MKDVRYSKKQKFFGVLDILSVVIDAVLCISLMTRFHGCWFAVFFVILLTAVNIVLFVAVKRNERRLHAIALAEKTASDSPAEKTAAGKKE